MKIESLHIDGFGVWNDKTWAPLSAGLNVFHVFSGADVLRAFWLLAGVNWLVVVILVLVAGSQLNISLVSQDSRKVPAES